MRLISRYELAFVSVRLTYRGATIEVDDVLVDTGAASTIINADLAADAGIYLTRDDHLRRIRGVGGHEHVFLRVVDRLAVGEHGLDMFRIEIGEMDYGFTLGGILGMDFLRATGAILDIGKLTMEFGA